MTTLTLIVAGIGIFVNGFFIGRIVEMHWGVYRTAYEAAMQGWNASINLAIKAAKTLKEKEGILSPFQIHHD